MSPTTKPNPAMLLTLATDRDDKGQTENYRVYAGGGQVQVKNKRGEVVQKAGLLGGNGTVYIANELAGDHTEWVLIPKPAFDALTGVAPAAEKKTKKGK